jgi:hypothetical protein
MAGLALGVRHGFQVGCPAFMFHVTGSAANIVFDNPLHGKHGLLNSRPYGGRPGVGPRGNYLTHFRYFPVGQAMGPRGIIPHDMTGQARLIVFARTYFGKDGMDPAKWSAGHRGMTI